MFHNLNHLVADMWIGLSCCSDHIYVAAWCQIVSLNDNLWGCTYIYVSSYEHAGMCCSSYQADVLKEHFHCSLVAADTSFFLTFVFVTAWSES